VPSRPGKRKHHRHWQPLTRPGPGARAAALVRYSPPERRGYTLETQRRMCQDHADKSGWHIVAWCEEPVTTARFEDIEHRPQFARLLESVERGEVDVVLCAFNDRWTRNELVAYASIAIMYNAGVWWETTDQRWDINKTREHGSDMLFALDNAQNAGYSRRLSEKTVVGKEARARKGLHNGDVGYGYLPPQYPKPPDNAPADWRPPPMPKVPDPQTWPALQLMAELRCRYWSCREIANELNRRGYRTAGRKPAGPKHPRTGDHPYTGPRLFTADSVRAIVMNEMYAEYEPGCGYGTIITPAGARVKGQHRAVWDHATWESMQQVAQDLYRAPHSTTVSRASYPLAGIITCFECGELMRSWHAHRNGHAYRYYTCWSKERGLLCTARPKSTPSDVIESAFEVLLATHQLGDDWRADLTAMSMQKISTRYWQEVEAKRKHLQAELDRVNAMFRYESITEEQFAKDVRSIREQLAAFPNNRQKENAQEAGELVASLSDCWCVAPLEKRAELVRLLLRPGGIVWHHGAQRISGIRPHPEFLPSLSLTLTQQGWCQEGDWLWMADRDVPSWLAK
jgi:DNA invertase Pin-like site-specific DNA recombinase